MRHLTSKIATLLFSVSAKEEDLQGFQSIQTESATFITTMPSEEQNSSSDNVEKFPLKALLAWVWL